MPVVPHGRALLEYPMVSVCHPLSECRRAVPALDDKYLPSSLAQFDPETVPHPPAPRPRCSRHLARRYHRFGELLPMPVSECQAGICGHKAHGTDGSCTFWPPGIVCAGVLVICLLV